MREAQKIKKTKIIIASLVAVLVVLIVIAMIGIRKSKEADRLQAYDDAVMLMEKGYYESVIPVFENLGDYKDSQARLAEAKAGLEAAEKEAKYNEALNLLDKGKDEDAYQLFQELGDYKDAASFELTFLMTRKVYTYNDSKYYNRTETVYNYDKEGRLARSTSGSGANKAVVNYSHDQNGTMTSIEEGYWSYSSTGKANTDSPHTITREYNEHGDIVKEITVKERIQSNGIPKLQQKIEEVYTYEYDDNGMMTAKTLAGTADTPQSDGSHKITTYSSAETCEYKYDQNGRILTSTTTNDSGNATTWTYSYDKHGNVSSMKAGKSTYSYEYTAKLVKQD